MTRRVSVADRNTHVGNSIASFVGPSCATGVIAIRVVGSMLDAVYGRLRWKRSRIGEDTMGTHERAASALLCTDSIYRDLSGCMEAIQIVIVARSGYPRV
jgi:hypothetical protein